MSTEFRPAHEIKHLLRLAIPVVITQLGLMAMGIVDIAMVGPLGIDAIGAVSLGEVWVFGTTVVAMGLLFGLDPLLAQAHGARDTRSVGLGLQRGLVMAVALSVPLMVLWTYTGDAMKLLGQDPDLIREAQRFADAQIFSAAPVLIFNVLRQFLQCRNQVLPIVCVTIAANLFNYAGNWVFVYGNLGCPALGVYGSGLATGVTKVLLMGGLATWILVRRLGADVWIPWSRAALHMSGFLQICRYGLPVAVQVALEVWLFQATSLIAGKLGTSELAAHIITLKIASLSFMMPLGISIASAVRIGNLIGAGDRPGAQRAAWLAFGLGAAIMAVWALVFVIFRWELSTFFTTDQEVIALSAAIFPIAAAFQIFDGLQAVGAGILRGNADTLPAALFSCAGFWLVAMPCVWLFAKQWNGGLPGIWWGLSVGLAVVAACFVAWVAWRGPRRERGRLVAED
ncbi:MAG: MATE family efflux transporter [Planctomycetota bacterium]